MLLPTMMARRVRGNSHARCRAGENLEMTSKGYLSLSTTINALIQFFESEDMSIFLAAPTGRAAKRMTEATGYEARTIHRMLELAYVPENEDSHMHYGRNEENPLDADVIIIDEMSMVDLPLMNVLLRAIVVGTRVIFWVTRTNYRLWVPEVF